MNIDTRTHQRQQLNDVATLHFCCKVNCMFPKRCPFFVPGTANAKCACLQSHAIEQLNLDVDIQLSEHKGKISLQSEQITANE